MRDRLKAEREDRGLTRLQMAQEMDVAYETYCQWETGVRWPSGKRQLSLVKFFGIPAEELLAVNQEKKGA